MLIELQQHYHIVPQRAPTVDRDGGIVVSDLAFYTSNPICIPLTSEFSVLILEKIKINEKEARVGLFKKSPYSQ